MDFWCLLFVLMLLSCYCNSQTGKITATSISFPSFADSLAISCGSSGESTAPDTRLWTGDVDLSASIIELGGKSAESRASNQAIESDSFPYDAARASRYEFSYRFSVNNPGEKLIRLHFNPDTYEGFENSEPIFSVKSGSFLLLNNFNPSLVADSLGLRYLIKEFCVYLAEDQMLLDVTFAPARTHGHIYAFVNGIEIVSVPSGLYFSSEVKNNHGALVVGQNHRFHIQKSTALEMIQRLNIGGSFISAEEDSTLFRRWDDDSNFLVDNGAVSFRRAIAVKYKNLPTYVAPVEVYTTARTTGRDRQLNRPGLKWEIPVEIGFRYLIRLHFCELESGISEIGQRGFTIEINGLVVEHDGDVIKWSGGNGVAVYRDYVVVGAESHGFLDNKYSATVSMRPKFGSNRNQTAGILNGLELFKISNDDGCLSSMLMHQPSTTLRSRAKKHQKAPPFDWRNRVATGFTVIITLLNLAVYHLRVNLERSSVMKNESLSPTEEIHRHFSLDEMRLATNNFSHELLIGKGGYGNVYKGSVDGGGSTVAIKRLKAGSRQGKNEYLTETKMLSKLRYEHLVSLVGFCNEGQEMIIVYEFAARGSLADQLYKIKTYNDQHQPLSWEQKLKICIGAAKGLHYLHNSANRIIHRDVKSSNILLDENWVAKISDFGLSKMGQRNKTFTHISTKVKGTYGYLDPEYYLTRKLTRKSDVYSFGVVLFEVLSGRPVLDPRLDEDQQILTTWARHCMDRDAVDQFIDSSMLGQISPQCKKIFVGIAARCLNMNSHDRPSMADVVMSLELAAMLQQSSASNLEASVAPLPTDKYFLEEFTRLIIQNSTLHLHISDSTELPSEQNVLGNQEGVVEDEGSMVPLGMADNMVQQIVLGDGVSRGSEQYIIDLVHPDVIPNLRRIAKFMFECNCGKECLETFIKVRQLALADCLVILKVDKLGVEDLQKLEWSSFSSRITRWVWAIKIFVRVFLVSEKFLHDQIFTELEPQSLASLVESSQSSMLHLLKFGHAMANLPRRQESLFKILDMYEVLTDILPDFKALYSDEAGSAVRRSCQTALTSLASCAKHSLDELPSDIRHTASISKIVPGGCIHPLTRYVMNYLGLLSDYEETLMKLLKDRENKSPTCAAGSPSELVHDVSSSYTGAPTAVYFRSIIQSLESSLGELSKLYKDESLRHFFLMNNTHYVAQKVGVEEIETIVGNKWTRDHRFIFQHHSLKYEKATWSSLLSLCYWDDSLSIYLRIRRASHNIKAFNAGFVEIYKTQTGWLIPDPQLREHVRISISSKVILAYRSFLGRSVSHLGDKNIKYSPDEIEARIFDLFEGFPKSLRRSFWK